VQGVWIFNNTLGKVLSPTELSHMNHPARRASFSVERRKSDVGIGDASAFSTMLNLESAIMEQVGTLCNSMTLLQFNPTDQTRKYAEQESLILSKEDWNLLVGGCKLVNFAKGDVIIEPRQQYQKLFQLSKGKVRVEADVQGVKKV
jgi:hypothetical protein